MPETLTIVIPSFEFRSGTPLVEVGSDAALGIFVPSNSSIPGRDVEVGLQYATYAALKAAFVRGGMRLGGFWALSGRQLIGARNQLYLEPFLGFDLGLVTLSGSLVVNLDKPAGFAFSGHGLYAFRLGASVDL
jgi:hypothetical protein